MLVCINEYWWNRFKTVKSFKTSKFTVISVGHSVILFFVWLVGFCCFVSFLSFHAFDLIWVGFSLVWKCLASFGFIWLHLAWLGFGFVSFIWVLFSLGLFVLEMTRYDVLGGFLANKPLSLFLFSMFCHGIVFLFYLEFTWITS